MINQYGILDKVALFLLIISVILHYLLPPTYQLGVDLVIALAVLCHSIKFWGMRNSIVYLFLAMVMGFAAEFFGINTGYIFGSYHYNPSMKPMIMGVPIFVPLFYYPLLYTANLTCVALSKKLLEKKNLIFLAIMTGAILMLKDMATDPLQSTVNNVWIWNTPGEYFGVPLHNFVGWFGVFAVMTIITLMFTWHRMDRRIQIHKNIFYFPILAFLVILVFGVTGAMTVPEEFRQLGNVSAFISIFVLGPYLLLAWFNGIKS